jgi:hypothetical protein
MLPPFSPGARVTRYGDLESDLQTLCQQLIEWGWPVDLTSLWILVANLHVGISRDFVAWLAQTIARVEDRQIASVLAKQLDDELGNAQFEQIHIHSHPLRRFLDGLDSWRATGSKEALLLPGRQVIDQLGTDPTACWAEFVAVLKTSGDS